MRRSHKGNNMVVCQIVVPAVVLVAVAVVVSVSHSFAG